MESDTFLLSFALAQRKDFCKKKRKLKGYLNVNAVYSRILNQLVLVDCGKYCETDCIFKIQ